MESTSVNEEPYAYAVMYSNSEYDYRIFANRDDADCFVNSLALEEGQDEPAVLCLYPIDAVAQHMSARNAAIEALKAAAGEAVKAFEKACRFDNSISIAEHVAVHYRLKEALAAVEVRA